MPSFRRTIDALPGLLDFASEFCARERVDEDARYAVCFALEEIFTNLVKYHPGNSHDIEVRLEREPGRLHVTFVDVDVEPFDIRQAPTRPTDVPIEERRPGGLGLQITRRMMDEVDYAYANRTSTITLIKRLE